MDFDGAGFNPQPWTWAMAGNGPYYAFMYSDMNTYNPPVMLDPPIMPRLNLAVDYVNQTASVIRSIEFGLVSRGHLLAEVQDIGTFSPAAQISHDFRVPNVWIGRTGLTCVPLRVTFSNGTIWNSPGPR